LGKLLEIKTFLDLLKEGKAKLATVNHNDSIEKAIRLMLDNEYSQLPVVKKDRVIGVISYESVARSLFTLLENKQIRHSEFRVEDLMEKVRHIFSLDEDLLVLLDKLADKSYVLVRDDSKVTDIITSYDALRFFRTCGEKFLLLSDIESLLRKIITEKLGSDFEEAERLMYEHAQKEMQKRERKVPKTAEYMEFWEYSPLILSNWGRFKEFFGDKKEVIEKMENARIIRNRTCHFSCPIGVDDSKDLKIILGWLENKQKQE
jgi:hypothetical protein